MENKELSAAQMDETISLVERMSTAQLKQLKSIVESGLAAHTQGQRLSAIDEIRRIAESVGLTPAQILYSGRGRPSKKTA